MIICHLQRLTEWCLNGCVNNDHLQATMAQLRQEQKELCQRVENERGEKKVRVEMRAFKEVRRLRGRQSGQYQWGGGVGLNRNWICFDFWEFPWKTADENWQVLGDWRCGTVRGFPSPLTTKGNYLTSQGSRKESRPGGRRRTYWPNRQFMT